MNDTSVDGSHVLSHVLQADACHMMSAWGGILIIVTSSVATGNTVIMFVAWFVDRESGESWEAALSNFAAAYASDGAGLNSRDVIIIRDGAASISFALKIWLEKINSLRCSEHQMSNAQSWGPNAPNVMRTVVYSPVPSKVRRAVENAPQLVKQKIETVPLQERSAACLYEATGVSSMDRTASSGVEGVNGVLALSGTRNSNPAEAFLRIMIFAGSLHSKLVSKASRWQEQVPEDRLLPNVKKAVNAFEKEHDAYSTRVEALGGLATDYSKPSEFVVKENVIVDNVDTLKQYTVTFTLVDPTMHNTKEWLNLAGTYYAKDRHYPFCNCGKMQDENHVQIFCRHIAKVATTLNVPYYAIIRKEFSLPWFLHQMAECGEFAIPGSTEIDSEMEALRASEEASTHLITPQPKRVQGRQSRNGRRNGAMDIRHQAKKKAKK